MTELFEVKTLKSSRFIKEKNTLVIITDYTKSHYPDKWIVDALRYMGGSKITGSTNSNWSAVEQMVCKMQHKMYLPKSATLASFSENRLYSDSETTL